MAKLQDGIIKMSDQPSSSIMVETHWQVSKGETHSTIMEHRVIGGMALGRDTLYGPFPNEQLDAVLAALKERNERALRFMYGWQDDMWNMVLGDGKPDNGYAGMFDKLYEATEEIKACRLASERCKATIERFNSSIAIAKLLTENKTKEK
jgi:hypothetical protein